MLCPEQVGSRGIKALTAAKTPMTMDSILEVSAPFCPALPTLPSCFSAALSAQEQAQYVKMI